MVINGKKRTINLKIAGIMADNKNSFIMYTDWKQDFEFLTDAEAGKLIKHLLQFASDENPSLENEDRLLQYAAQKMKAVMKKDLKKYEEVIQKRAEAGKKGGVNSGKSRTSKQNEANEANASTSKQNEHDNVNDNVNDILLEKESKYVEEEGAKISDFKSFLKTEKQIQMDRLKMAHKLSDADLDEKINEFVEKKVSWGEDEKWKDRNDMAKNFEFWLSKNPKIEKQSYLNWDKKHFFEEISQVAPTLSKQIKQEFFDHYAQPTPNGTMLLQTFPAWDTKTRIRKWIESKKSKNYAN